MRKEGIINDGGEIPESPGLFDPFFNPDLFNYDQDRYTDWQKEMIGGTARYNDLQGNISGGSRNVQYIVGANYHDETTVFPGKAKDNKANLHFSISGNSENKKFMAALTGAYMSNWNTFPRQDFTRFISLAPNAPSLYNADGTLNFQPYYIQDFNLTFSTFSNPVSVFFQPYSSNVYNLTSNFDLSYKLLTSLTLKATLGYNDLHGNSFIAVNPSNSLNPSDKEAMNRGELLRESNFFQNGSK